MNLSTLTVLLLLIAVTVIIIVRGIINRKNGKKTCSCGCGGCPMSDTCHNKTKNK